MKPRRTEKETISFLFFLHIIALNIIHSKRLISKEYSINSFSLENMLKEYMNVYDFLINKKNINI